MVTEIERAIAKHPNGMNGASTSVLRRAGIVAEESGELMQAAIDVTRPGTFITPELQEQVRKELIQTAAMAFLWLHRWEMQKWGPVE